MNILLAASKDSSHQRFPTPHFSVAAYINILVICYSLLFLLFLSFSFSFHCSSFLCFVGMIHCKRKYSQGDWDNVLQQHFPARYLYESTRNIGIILSPCILLTSSPPHLLTSSPPHLPAPFSLLFFCAQNMYWKEDYKVACRAIAMRCIRAANLQNCIVVHFGLTKVMQEREAGRMRREGKRREKRLGV